MTFLDVDEKQMFPSSHHVQGREAFDIESKKPPRLIR